MQPRVITPRSDLIPEVLTGEKNPDATRYGWSALLPINCADLTASRNVGHDYIPPRALVVFNSIETERPAENEENFRDYGPGKFEIGSERVWKSAQVCSYEIFQNYSPIGYTDFTSLVGRSDAVAIYNDLYPQDFATFREAFDYFESDAPDQVVAQYDDDKQKAASIALSSLRAACQRAKTFADMTLDDTETEMRDREKGKKRYDALDLRLYSETGRTKPERQQTEAAAAFGTQVAVAAAGSQAELASAVTRIAEAQAAFMERMAESEKRQAQQTEATNRILNMLAKEKK